VPALGYAKSWLSKEIQTLDQDLVNQYNLPCGRLDQLTNVRSNPTTHAKWVAHESVPDRLLARILLHEHYPRKG